MPVIVVGADTPLGLAIMDELASRDGEVRAFVTDVGTAENLKRRKVKVAIGDVSDASHVGGACLNAFCAVLVTQAANDSRERSFAGSASEVLDGWIEAIGEGGVTRAIWVTDPATTIAVPPGGGAPEVAVVATAGRPLRDIAAEVADLESVAQL